MQAALSTRIGVARPATRTTASRRSVVQPVRAAAAEAEATDDLGFKLMRKGVKVAAKETLLSPRCDARPLSALLARLSPLAGPIDSQHPDAARVCGRGGRGVVGTPRRRRRPAFCRAAPLTSPPLPPLQSSRFYTTDFDEVDAIFNLESNPNLPMEELEAMLEEFRK